MNRLIDNIYIYLTYSCNMRCRHCWASCISNEERPMYLDVDIARQVLQDSKNAGASTIKLTGGEPLLHPGVSTIISMVNELRLRLTMESNGALLTSKLAHLISQNSDPFVSVSLDSHLAPINDAIRGCSNAHERAIKAVHALVDNNIKTQIVTSLFSCNMPHVRDLAQLAEDLGCSSLKLNIIQPAGRALGLYNSKTKELPSLKALISLQETIIEIRRSLSIPILYDLPIVFKPLSSICDGKQIKTCFCNISRIIGLLPDGHYSLCGVGHFEKELILGHAHTTSLESACNSPVMRTIAAGMPKQLQGICSRCSMKASCNGACIAQNYSVTRNLWSPFWFCQQAYEEGFFPEERLLR